MRETFGLGGINWCWYLQADLDDVMKTAHIIYHGRFHNERDNHPKTSKRQCEVIEDSKRNIVVLRIDGVRYRVTNVANVFSYNNHRYLEF